MMEAKMAADRNRVIARGERGQSLVEFAVSVVILLFLLVGIMDGARTLFTYLSMRDAAQEGALYGSYQPTDSAGIHDRACGASNLMAALCDEGGIFITDTETVLGQRCMGTTGTTPHGISILVDYPNFPLTMPFMSTIIGRQSVPISVTVIDTILAPQCP
jgi:Flp pilus assembly protein TadG